MLWAVLSGIALLVIVGLGFYAGKLLFLLKQQKVRQEAARQSRIENITDSIIVIAKAMDQQQCDLSEGVIRIVNLLNALPIRTPPDFKAQYPQIYSLFTEVSGFAILEERQKLPKSERKKQDVAREQIESEYESKVLAELPPLLSYCQTLISAK
ncbi:coproporphyrinogen III oxidase [Alteromonas sp. KUL156]|uniref:DUF2489 domain-containing protein n=1 Tax=Alteromonas sp. KUL106 TaxID=2480799 RepID=UPI0012E5D302|nr:DUF2489 domain-containing protein [Alteromonas sp. KUL106]GFD69931.1 coproporphyrinogen III oxidase [Alteromonas sp. KUL106]GFD78917.1 coproporphyrinogen III oxidase [Tenacibaculum sp. KUL118]GFD93546.1 coproporphyrinogen III oxidase [Alteromonas sp. KUL154]GFE01192.1 coproporphyrinogen III oxidase [Alteromonas sp. KUL156]